MHREQHDQEERQPEHGHRHAEERDQHRHGVEHAVLPEPGHEAEAEPEHDREQHRGNRQHDGAREPGRISSITGRLVWSDRPRSPWSARQTKSAYWTWSGRSSPITRRISASRSGVAVCSPT